MALIGREAERDRLLAAIAAARDGRSTALLVHGDAGIGKTALLEEAIAAADGLRVLRARGFEGESDLPFAGLHDLVAPLLDLRERIPAVQARALGAALALEPPDGHDRFAIPAALLSLVGQAADAGPLLLVVDDLHWIDEGTCQALTFVARRLDADGVVLLLSARDGEPWPFDPTGIERLHVGGLSDEAARELLAGGTAVASEVVDALVRTAAGNPLALRELPQTLTDDQRSGRAPLPRPLRPGAGVEAAFSRRLAALPDDTRQALLVLSAMETRRTDVLLRALEVLGLPATALDAAQHAGIVTVADERTDFTHPLLRSTVYHAAASSRRRAAHHVLAEIAPDAQRRAWHLAISAVGTDDAAAEALEAAGRDARGRGGAAEAARAFARAAELTSDREQRARLQLEAATDEVAAGHMDRALHLVEQGLQVAGDEGLRTQLRRVRAQVALRQAAPTVAFELLEAEAERLAAVDAGQAAVLLLEACAAPMMTGDMDLLRATAERARALAQGAGLELGGVIAELIVGEALIARGDAPEGAAILAELEAPLLSADLMAGMPDVVGMAGHSSIWIGAYDRADAVLSRMVDGARRGAALGGLVYPLAARSHLELRRGRWIAALADADESVRLARDTGYRNVLPLSLATLARVEAAMGRAEEARRHAEESVGLARSAGAAAILLYGLGALGFEALSGGRLEEAVEHLERAAETERALRQDQAAIVQWAPDRVEALVRLGRLDEASRALAELAAQAHRTQGAWALACVERGRGMLSGDDAFRAHFEAALRHHDRDAQPFERARTELAFGERLRRAGQRVEAREWIGAALQGFERLGARPWAERAQAELRATGRTARRRDASTADELTPQELQIAGYVTEGMTNREIAAAMFLSPKTIEYHLRSVFRKLDVRSRTELARRFALELPVAA
ncbi:MAG TPA: AAA family ATPase [Capillimicrobium sp.]|nr:AAA family ATPase [Capillimicrobium sp.]